MGRAKYLHTGQKEQRKFKDCGDTTVIKREVSFWSVVKSITLIWCAVAGAVIIWSIMCVPFSFKTGSTLALDVQRIWSFQNIIHLPLRTKVVLSREVNYRRLSVVQKNRENIFVAANYQWSCEKWEKSLWVNVDYIVLYNYWSVMQYSLKTELDASRKILTFALFPLCITETI